MRHLILAIMLVACAASQRQDTLKTAVVTIDTTHAAWIAYDTATQATIVANATSAADVAAKLAAYRVNQAKIEGLFNAAYRAVAAAATANDDPSITGMQAALALLATAVAPYLGASK